MNVANMTALAALLDTVNPAKFSMHTWVGWMGGVEMNGREEHHNAGECGTTACIAGWAFVLQYPNKDHRQQVLLHSWVDDEAQLYLDLTHEEKNYLFMGKWSSTRHPKNPDVGTGTPQEAAAAVRAMIAHGGIPE